MITFGPKVNRSYSLHLPFAGEYSTVDVFFSKSNTYIGFVTDQLTHTMKRNGEISSTVYRDLSQSGFASTFLDIKSFKSNNLDVRCQFNNILPEYKDKIQYVANETIKISKVSTENGSYDSCIYIYVFGLSDYNDDFLYVIAERQHIDVVLNKKLVRTCGLQLSTKECLSDVNKMISHYSGKDEQIEEHKANTRKTIEDILNVDIIKK